MEANFDDSHNGMAIQSPLALDNVVYEFHMYRQPPTRSQSHESRGPCAKTGFPSNLRHSRPSADSA